MKFALFLFLIVQPGLAFATLGHDQGGGGDATELRVNLIRADLLAWVRSGGSASLTLPIRADEKQFVGLVTPLLEPQKVIVTAVTTAQENTSQDPELKVSVGGAPKTCRGFISAKEGRAHILCNIERFRQTGEADQYRLVFHEYLGLVGIEHNAGGASDYQVSSQITDYLKPEVVLRLAIYKQNTRPVSTTAEQSYICAAPWYANYPPFNEVRTLTRGGNGQLSINGVQLIAKDNGFTSHTYLGFPVVIHTEPSGALSLYFMAAQGDFPLQCRLR